MPLKYCGGVVMSYSFCPGVSGTGVHLKAAARCLSSRELETPATREAVRLLVTSHLDLTELNVKCTDSSFPQRPSWQFATYCQ